MLPVGSLPRVVGDVHILTIDDVLVIVDGQSHGGKKQQQEHLAEDLLCPIRASGVLL